MEGDERDANDGSDAGHGNDVPAVQMIQNVEDKKRLQSILDKTNFLLIL